MNAEELREHLAEQSKLYKLEGSMLAECPVEETVVWCGIYHDRDGLVIYISDYGADTLDAFIEMRDIDLPEYLERHDIEGHFA